MTDTTLDVKSLTDDALRALVEAATAELAARAGSAEPVRVSVAFGSYNERRYGRPWIARVTSWPVGGKAELEFGEFLGDHRNGGGGEVEIMARPGEIVRWGQKDFRGKNTEADWGVVAGDGAIISVTQAEAREQYLGQ